MYAWLSVDVTLKVIEHLDGHLRQALAFSPLCLLATSDADGHCAFSPRGDSGSAVQIADDRTLFLPDQPDDNPLDKLRNTVQNLEVGLTFPLPGVNEVARVNGLAYVPTAPVLLERCGLDGRPPRTAIVVKV